MAKAFGQYQYKIMTGDVDPATDAVKLMLVNSSFAGAYSQTSMVLYSDVSAYEVTGTGYTAGGKLATGKSVSNGGSLKTVLTTDAVAWPASSISADGAIWYHETSGVLIAYQAFGSTQTSSSSVFTVTPSALDGIAFWTAAS